MFFLLGSFLPADFAGAAVLKNAGFIQGNIWYSENSFFEGDKVRIYSAIFNNSGSDLIGAAEFYDKEEKIGSSNFSAINGRLVEVWTDWTVTVGGHEIFAKIVNAKIAKVGGGFEDVELPSLTTAKSAKSALPKPVVVPKPLPASEPLRQSEESGTGATKAKESAEAAVGYAKAAISAVNGAADNLAQKIESKKEIIKKEIEALNNVVLESDSTPANPESDDSSGSKENVQFERPLKYVYLASLGALGLVLENKILLYIVLFFAGYKIIKYLFRRFYTLWKRS